MKSATRLIFLAVLTVFSVCSFASEFKNWIPIYAHDSAGNPISGSFSALVDAVKDGADVRIGLVPAADGRPTSFRNPRTVVVNGSEVVAISDMPTPIGDGSGHLTLITGLVTRELFSTRGKRLQDIYYLNGSPYAINAVENRELHWFVSK